MTHHFLETDLRNLPSAENDRATSTGATASASMKKAWWLPFHLHLFGTMGRLEGDSLDMGLTKQLRKALRRSIVDHRSSLHLQKPALTVVL
jgi:hypothetical protein